MPKIDNIFDAIGVGMKAENLRQKAIASNVANLETPGYRRVDVEFKDMLAKAMDSSEDADLNEIEPQLFEPKDTAVKSNGNDVSWEAEVGQMVKNTLRYKTYVRLLQKKYAQIDLAINVR